MINPPPHFSTAKRYAVCQQLNHCGHLPPRYRCVIANPPHDGRAAESRRGTPSDLPHVLPQQRVDLNAIIKAANY